MIYVKRADLYQLVKDGHVTVTITHASIAGGLKPGNTVEVYASGERHVKAVVVRLEHIHRLACRVFLELPTDL